MGDPSRSMAGGPCLTKSNTAGFPQSADAFRTCNRPQTRMNAHFPHFRTFRSEVCKGRQWPGAQPDERKRLWTMSPCDRTNANAYGRPRQGTDRMHHERKTARPKTTVSAADRAGRVGVGGGAVQSLGVPIFWTASKSHFGGRRFWGFFPGWGASDGCSGAEAVAGECAGVHGVGASAVAGGGIWRTGCTRRSGCRPCRTT